MTDSLKSVLFVDYDSLHLALRARDPALGRRFAARPGLLLEAIEAGGLIGSDALGPARRRILMRRCYADPRLIGSARDHFVAHGFQIVDCPTLPGHERNSAEVQITLDTIDALAHPTAFDEFILLAADSDFTPLIYRLRAHNRATTIYAKPATAGAYRAFADGIVEEGALAALLAAAADGDRDEDEEEQETARPAPGRDDLAALARRIHNATNVPLFPPKVYAELFRALTDEIAEQGYHFQQTAENVAGRLIAAGRKASRRQVAFVVKGLALKGHVLSERDTPQRLAEVFREQVLYLARHAGIEIDPRVERQVAGWIAGSIAPDAAEPPAVAAVVPQKADPVEATLAVEAEAMAGPLETPPEPATEPDEEALPDQEPAEAVLAEAAGTVDDEEAEGPPAEVAPAEEHLAEEPPAEEDLAALADAPEHGPEAGADDDEAQAPPVAISPAAPRAVPAVRPPVPRGAAQRAAVRPAEAPLDPFESSLLAAITSAVKAADTPGPGSAPPVAAPVGPAEADARIEPTLESARSAAELAADADIGDEIQRILAAYNQSRKPAGG